MISLFPMARPASAKLFVHIRAVAGGRAVATVLPFVGATFDGETADEARARAIEAARETLGELSGTFRAELAEDAAAEAETISLAVGQRHSEEKLPLSLSVVVVARQRSGGVMYSVLLPGLSGWSVTAPERTQALELAASTLGDAIGNWVGASLMALDLTGPVELHPVELPFNPEREDSAAAIDPAAALSADDLTAMAAAGRLGRLDRRDPLVERVLAVLAGEGRASVLLVGPGDVGKSALTHEVAARLASGDVPPALQGRALIRLSANELIAGARFTGMWQQRARQLVAVARRSGAIVAMGDPNGIVDAGRWSESDNNLSRALRPYMESGDLRLICEGTEEAVAATAKREASFIEAFHRIEVPEPDPDAAREILRAAARRIEVNHDLVFDEDGIRSALDLTRRFEPYRALPGKAVRLLEETAQLTAAEGAGRLGQEEVTRVFARRTGLPLAMLSDEVPLRTREVRSFFEERVLGQPDAVEAMVDLIAVVKAALADPGKPLGTLFFVGPTGVGKTELSKALAEYLFGSRERVLRFDMGEYASGDAAARLTGTAWDRHSEGELTRRVHEQPFCVVLLDEIEKAHPTVFDVLLPALGEGRLTDASGRTADLRNAIVIMTSNLGAATSGSSGLGFATVATDESERQQTHFVSEAERFFRPEFFNRIDRVLTFAPLDQDTIGRIARRELGRLLLREGITRRQLLVELDDPVIERLAAAGFHPRYGARPLHREIERAVIRPLARLIVEQLPAPGDLIRIHTGQDGIELSLHRVREPEPRATASPARGREPVADATTARMVERAHALMDEIAGEAESPAAVTVAAELSDLLEQVNRPGFWDRQETARATMNRSYQLQRINDGLRHLADRAEGLSELAQKLHAQRDRSRLSELRAALGEVEDGLAILRLRIAGAAVGTDEPEAMLTVVPIGTGADAWASALIDMYAAWATRTGREVTRATDGESTLRIVGPGSHALLQGECGLHRRERSGAEGQRELARVMLAPIARAGSESTREPDGEAGRDAPAEADEGGLIVRVYSEGARTGVRDPRSGVRVGNLAAVLGDGQIDEFILAIAARRGDRRT